MKLKWPLPIPGSDIHLLERKVSGDEMGG